MRALLLSLVVVAAGTGCKKKPTCDAISVAVVRTQLTKAAARPEPKDEKAPPRIAAADGRGRVKGAVRVRLRGTYPPELQFDGLTVTALDDSVVRGAVYDALAAAGAQVLEVSGTADGSYPALATVLRALDDTTEVHLITELRTTPPAGNVAPWAVEAAANRAVPVATYDFKNRSLDRALGPRCAAELATGYKGLGGLLGVSDDELAAALPAAVERCGCAGADLTTAAWIYELLWFPQYETAWLKVPAGAKTISADAVLSLQDLADQLEVAP